MPNQPNPNVPNVIKSEPTPEPVAPAEVEVDAEKAPVKVEADAEKAPKTPEFGAGSKVNWDQPHFSADKRFPVSVDPDGTKNAKLQATKPR